MRTWYSPSQWEDLIYGQLQYGPIIYSGVDSYGGHAFVCDGYNGAGLFHFNWGWGGMSDGYYTLSALDPTQQGIGGSSGGFDFRQEIVAGMQPMQPGSQYAAVMGTESPIYVDLRGNLLTFEGSFYNYGVATLPLMKIGVQIEGENTDMVIPYGELSDLPQNYGFIDIEVELPELADGVYTLTPVFSAQFGDNANEQWQPLHIPYIYSQEFYLTVRKGACEIEYGPEVDAAVESLTLDTQIYPEAPFIVNYTLDNFSEKDFYGPIAIIFASTETGAPMYVSESSLVIVPAQTKQELTQTTKIAYVLKAGGSEVVPGEYLITLAYGDPSSGYYYLDPSVALRVTIDEADETVFSVSDLRATDGSTLDMDPAALSFSADITCESGLFFKSLRLGIFREGETRSTAVFSGGAIMLQPTQTGTMLFNGSLPQYTPGEKFTCAVFDDGVAVSDFLDFSIKGTSGIAGAADEQTGKVYNLQGIEVGADICRLPAGIYITGGKKIFINK